MTILASAEEIKNVISKGIKEFEYISFSLAWACLPEDIFELLKEKNRNNIHYSTVGLHFMQTHPDFIQTFINEVKFIQKKTGVFHPKMYLFYDNEKKWECLIGSANFTQSALHENDEVMTYFGSDDNPLLFESVQKIIQGYFSQASYYDENKLDTYRKEREIQKVKKEDPVLDFKKEEPSILDMDWQVYYQRLKKEGDRFENRLLLLEKAHEYFQLGSFNETVQAYIAGVEKHGLDIEDWYLFGSMRRTGLSNEETRKRMFECLACIPLEGEVTKEHYNQFVTHVYRLRLDRIGLGSMTRLLAMKRPDQFFCLTGENKKKLYSYFNISHEVNNPKKYWDEIIIKVRNSKWYCPPELSDNTLRAWRKRVALMDTIFYQGS